MMDDDLRNWDDKSGRFDGPLFPTYGVFDHI